MNDELLDYTTMIINGGSSSSVLTGAMSYDPTDMTISSNTVKSNTVSSPEDLLDEFEMNRFAVDHKVTEVELMKLKEVAPDYASEIKENIAKNLARDITKKITYKKKHDKDADVHHFIGRVWVFTDEEMLEIARRIR